MGDLVACDQGHDGHNGHDDEVGQSASHVLANKDRYSPTIVKRANFAHNAAKWKHADGGYMPKYAEGKPPYADELYDPSLMGVAGQIGAGLIGTGAQLRNINRLKAPGVVQDVRFRGPGSPALVDYTAQLSDIDRGYREGQEMINRELGSGAAKLANLSSLPYIDSQNHSCLSDCRYRSIIIFFSVLATCFAVWKNPMEWVVCVYFGKLNK